MEAGHYSRNFIVLSVAIDTRQGILIPNYNFFGDQVCAVLSILYVKRFDNHGFLVSHGMFYVPEFNEGAPTNYFNAAPYNHQPRKDGGVPLELQRFASVAPIFTEESMEENFKSILLAASRFYLRSLQAFDQEPEAAYLDLITCGEILANFYEYTPDQRLDENTKQLLAKVEKCEDGADLVHKLQGKLRQIKQCYTLTLIHLLTDIFFTGSECTMEAGVLEKDGIEKRLKASYDLRSKYIHTGINFGHHMIPLDRSSPNEVQLYEYSVDKPQGRGQPTPLEIGGTDPEQAAEAEQLLQAEAGRAAQQYRIKKELAKVIHLAPTYFGMERIMRYCLLRLIHLNGVPHSCPR
jgi:hypothetical protein